MIGISKSDQLRKNGRIKKPVYKNKEYLSWLAQKSCLVCGAHPVELHHVDRGIGARRDDSAIPLCHAHHLGDKWSAHGADAILFNAVYPKDHLLEIARKLHEEWKSETN